MWRVSAGLGKECKEGKHLFFSLVTFQNVYHLSNVVVSTSLFAFIFLIIILLRHVTLSMTHWQQWQSLPFLPLLPSQSGQTFLGVRSLEDSCSLNYPAATFGAAWFQSLLSCVNDKAICGFWELGPLPGSIFAVKQLGWTMLRPETGGIFNFSFKGSYWVVCLGPFTNCIYFTSPYIIFPLIFFLPDP